MGAERARVLGASPPRAASSAAVCHGLCPRFQSRRCNFQGGRHHGRAVKRPNVVGCPCAQGQRRESRPCAAGSLREEASVESMWNSNAGHSPKVSVQTASMCCRKFCRIHSWKKRLARADDQRAVAERQPRASAEPELESLSSDLAGQCGSQDRHDFRFVRGQFPYPQRAISPQKTLRTHLMEDEVAAKNNAKSATTAVVFVPYFRVTE